ncbi:hypothetical protein J1614_010379 [Plenodomus biglobosus]|nr:hypothetical protein J1614_010379 [Plenodomus biglobosus]
MSPTPSSPTKPKDPPPCRFPLDNATSSTLTLPCGRKLGYAQYGDPIGKPIFFLHGLPGSRLEGAYFDALGKELGARIIAPDRPGCGWSSPQRGRGLLDWPGDLEALAEYLKVEEYSVMGASGGGPYVLSCAYALPAAKLKSATLICGLGPPDIGMRGAGLPHRLAFPYGWRWSPTFLLRWFFTLDPSYRLQLPESTRLELKLSAAEQAKISHPKDKAIYADADVVRMGIRDVSEALSQGLEVAREDGRVSCEAWPFRVQDIRQDLKMKLWYGKEDVFVPINHGVQIAARLGGRAECHFEDDTHSSIFFNWRREVLESILGDM